eukprot:422400_1
MAESFAEYDKSEFKLENNTITQVSKRSSGTVYGSVSIPWNNNQKYQWKFKINSSCGYIVIGIHESTQSKLMHFWLGKNDYGYGSIDGVIYENGKQYGQGERYGPGAIIIMEFDTSMKTLRFCKNGKYYSPIKITNNHKKNVQYKMAVDMSAGLGVSSISLLSYLSDNNICKQKELESPNAHSKYLSPTPLYSLHTKKTNKRNKFTVGQKIQCIDNRYKGNKKYDAIIKKVEKNKVFVVYKGYKESGGQWISNWDWTKRIFTSAQKKENKQNKENELEVTLQLSMKERISFLEKKISSLNKIIQNKTNRNHIYEKANASLENDKKELNNQMKQIRTENNKYKNANVSLQNENNQLKLKIGKLREKQKENKNTMQQFMKQKQILNEQISKLKNDKKRLYGDQKENTMLINDLKKEIKDLKSKKLDCSKYLEWKTEEILQWILTLENGRYVKYENVLCESLKDEGVKGVHLPKVDSSDVKRWGIKQFDDIKNFTESIQQLTEKYQLK